jgi:circadian clock protein KaiB
VNFPLREDPASADAVRRGTGLFGFRLFVAGDTPNSVQALSNLVALCNERLADRHEIDVVDVFLHPARALAEGIFMTPTLIRLGPGPLVRIVGTLSDAPAVAMALGLGAVAA